MDNDKTTAIIGLVIGSVVFIVCRSYSPVNAWTYGFMFAGGMQAVAIRQLFAIHRQNRKPKRVKTYDPRCERWH